MLATRLDFLTTVTQLRKSLQDVLVVGALYTYSEEEWARCNNVETGEHLIKGIFTSSVKTDAVRGYISKLVKLYMNGIGRQPGAWTRETLSNEHNLTKAVIDRISVTQIEDNDQLFRAVVSRLFGIDDFIVKAGMARDNKTVMLTQIINYLRYSEVSEIIEQTDDLPLIKDLKFLVDNQKLDDVFFSDLIAAGNSYLDVEHPIHLEGVDLLGQIVNDLGVDQTKH